MFAIGRLRACAERALSSAVDLVAKCSGRKFSEVEKLYRDSWLEDDFDFEDDGEDDWNPDDLLLEQALAIEADAEENLSSGHEIQGVLDHIQELAEQECQPEEAEQIDLSKIKDQDAELSDGKVLIDITDESTEEGSVTETRSFPKTLSEALQGSNMWGRLWQLAVYLRCGEQGMDSLFLKRAELVRKRSRTLNWQQNHGIDQHDFAICIIF